MGCGSVMWMLPINNSKANCSKVEHITEIDELTLNACVAAWGKYLCEIVKWDVDVTDKQ